MESPEAEFYEVDPQTGATSLRLPGIDVGEFASSAWNGFWPPMPMTRKALLTSGLFVLVVVGAAWPKMEKQRLAALHPYTAPGSTAPGE